MADLVADQVARGWDVAVACPQHGDLAAEIARMGGRHVEWSATRSIGPGVLPEMRALQRIIARVRPDLVHLHSSKAGLAGRVVLRGALPTVFQPHAWAFHAVAGPLRGATLAWERLAARWAHALAVLSDEEQRDGERAGIRASYVRVRNGVDLARLPEATAAERWAARQRLGVGAAPLAVCVGRLCRQKGQDLLLEAWTSVRQTVADARIVFVGDGPDRSDLEGRAAEGVLFVGRTPVPMDWLRAADVVVLPSRWEGLSFALLEAMAIGRSVVATDVGGARECLSQGGGAVVPREDVPALAGAVIARLLDPSRAAREGARARATVEHDHDLRRSTDEIAALYARLLLGR